MNCICWIDIWPVLMLSTIHKVGPEHTVETVRRRPRITSTTSRKLRRVFGNASTKRLAIPKIVYDYNHNMNGVDIVDQLRSNHTTHIRGRRTSLLIFYWLLDTMVINSFLVWRSLKAGKWKDARAQKQFRSELAWNLIFKGAATSSQSSTVARPLMATRPTWAQLCNSSARILFTTPHLPKHAKASDERRVCVLCSFLRGNAGLKQKEAAKSYVYCSGCSGEVFLCVSKERNCSEQFHTISNLSELSYSGAGAGPST